MRTTIRGIVSALFLLGAGNLYGAEASSNATPSSDDYSYKLSVDQATVVYNSLLSLNEVTKVDKNQAQYKTRMKFGSTPEKSSDVHFRLGEMMDALREFVGRAQQEEQAELNNMQIDRAQAAVNEAAANCPAPGDSQTRISSECALARLSSIKAAVDHAREIQRIHCEVRTIHLEPPTKDELNLSDNNLTPSETSAFTMLLRSKNDIESEARESCRSPGGSSVK